MKATAVVELGSRDKLLDAAEALFSRRGYAGVGMSEVAEAVGLGKSSLFHHFRSKTELYAAVVGRILDIVEQRTTAALAAGGTPALRFDHWLDALIDTLVEHRTSARLLLRTLFEDDDLTGGSEEEKRADDTIKRLFGAIGKLLKEGMEAGYFRLASIPHFLQSLVGLTVYHFASGEFGDELFGRSVFTPALVKQRKEEVKALLHHGLIKQAPARRPTSIKGGD